MTAPCAPPRPTAKPACPPPPGACDAHAHVFGPPARFPYAAERSYTPPDAPFEAHAAMLDALGFARGVLVQGSAHGTDNAAMLDALGRAPERLRGVAVGGEAARPSLDRWHALGVRGLRFNHFFRGGRLHYRGGIGFDEAEALAPALADRGWHVQLWIDVVDLPDLAPRVRRLPVPVVIDHMGRTDAAAGTGTPGFQSLLRLLGEGGCWVKLSGAYRLSTDDPLYPEAKPFHEALVAANPDRLVWGTDWPHPRVDGTMPDDAELLDLFTAWTPDAAARRRILVENPARLYGFPPA